MSAVNIIFAVTGVIFMVLGYLIWKHKYLQLLAGYDEKKVTDKEGLAKYTGKHLLIMGGLVLAISINGMVSETNTIAPYFIIVIFISIKMVRGTKEYEKN